MTLRYFFTPPQRLSLIVLSLWATTAALAQIAPVPPTPQKKPTMVKAEPAAFQSALKGYKPFADEKAGNWKEANALTARIGGWRAYAKEAAQTEPDPHVGHAKPAKAEPTQAEPTQAKP